MDEFVKKTLTEWQLTDLLLFFQVKKVTESKFKNLTDVDIDDIIPNVCQNKDLFKSFYDTFKLLQSSTVTDSTDTFYNEECDNPTANCSIPTVDIDKSLNDFEVQLSKENTPMNHQHFHFLYLQAYVPNFDACYSEIQKNKIYYKLCSDKNNTLGNLILMKYAKDKDIRNLRDELSKIIINYEVAKTLLTKTPYVISTEEFEEIALSILEIFPTEEKNCYYEAAYTCKDSDNNSVDCRPSRKNQSGSLYREYKNQRDIARASQIFPTLTRGRVATKKTVTSAAVENIDLSILTENVDNLVPEKKDNLVNVWKKSFIYRHNTIFKNKNGLNIIEIYPALKSDLAQALILSDFQMKYDITYQAASDEQYPPSQKLIQQWPVLSKKIIALAKANNNISSKKSSKTSVSSDISHESSDDNSHIVIPNYSGVGDILKKNEAIHNDEQVSALAFLLLPNLIKYAFKGKLKQWRPQKSDIGPSFIQHIQKHEDLSDVCKKMQLKYKEKGVAEQPFIVFCGTLHSATCYHVLLDSIIYTTKSAIESVDFLYKLFFILKINYPHASYHIWSFLQKGIYRMEKERKIVASQTINEFMNDLKKF